MSEFKGKILAGVAASVVVALSITAGVYFLSQSPPLGMSSSQTTSTGIGVGSSVSPASSESSSATSDSFSSQSSSASLSHAGLYKLDFVQQNRCGYGGWVYPWGVMLNGGNSQTIVQPSNETLGLLYNNDPNNGTYSQIVFWVPNGMYNYTVLPIKYFSQSGIVTIRDNDTSINVYQYFLAEGCTSTTSTSSAKNP